MIYVVVGDSQSCGYCDVIIHSLVYSVVFFFFFQAEDGIRDLTVTGVQTCALPISRPRDRASRAARRAYGARPGHSSDGCASWRGSPAGSWTPAPPARPTS